MRGHVNPQAHMFGYLSPEQRVPANHPLRSIKAYTDSALKQMRPVLDGIHSQIGRPSIPPERLPKGQLLIALYSMRSDRLFRETLDYDILFRWFLEAARFHRGRGLNHRAIDAEVLSRKQFQVALRAHVSDWLGLQPGTRQSTVSTGRPCQCTTRCKS